MTTLPTDRAAREAYILEAVRDGRAIINWVPLRIADHGHELVVWVTGDAVRVDGVRVAVTPKVQQAVATMLRALPLTSKLADLMHAGAGIIVRAQPSGGWTGSPYSGQVSYSTAQMVEHSERVDRALGRSAPGTIASTVGKDWILSRKAVPPVAANYGWHDRAAPYLSPGGLKLWQQTGTRHNTDHGDYSQIMRLARRDTTLDGQPVDLGRIYQSAELAPLVSYEGPLATLSLTTPGSSGSLPPPSTPAPAPKPVPTTPTTPGSRPAPTTPAVRQPTPEPPLSVAAQAPSATTFVVLGGFFAAMVAWFRRRR